MGSKPKKIVKKIIPKEIRPAVPFIAAAFGAPYLAGSSFMTSAVSNPFVRNLIAKSITSAATTKAMGGDTKQAIRSGILSAAPDIAGAGLEKFAGADLVKYGPQAQGSFSGAIKGAQELASKGASALQPETFMGKAKLIGGQTAIEAAARAVELNEKALRDYAEQLRSQGIMDTAERRNQIFSYFSRAGYADDEINSMLDKYGYAYGGRVGYKEGGGIQALIDYLKEIEDEEDEFNLSNLSTGLEGVKSGYEIATGQPLMGLKPQPTRFGLADGGLMSLRAGGMPAEMDMRGGGFVPIGKQRRADDVPARLSKDEFVLTAKAVDGVGKATTGNAKDGAKIMYDFMNKYEALA